MLIRRPTRTHPRSRRRSSADTLMHAHRQQRTARLTSQRGHACAPSTYLYTGLTHVCTHLSGIRVPLPRDTHALLPHRATGAPKGESRGG
eukprot:6202061-Pleurochrysis_carterae.AAC.1